MAPRAQYRSPSKTSPGPRLALAVAAAVAPLFADGCWFAELAPAGTGDEVVGAIATAMGVPARDQDVLVRYVAERQVLVVLDNCEHVLEHAARLAEALLGAGREVVVVATFREPLGVVGEVVRGVASLATPEGDDVAVAEAAGASAVRLFVARAQAASERFALDDTNVAAVVAICRQLDGIPLAIELAAARVRAMGAAEIARRLGERFRLLAGGRGAQERHRTLQAAVGWSHDLLSEAERRVFRRLAVFPASFDLEAAEAVVDDDGLDVVDLVVRLVERSLVHYDDSGGRYRLLETLRQYAADRLAEAGDTDAARDRHANFYAALAAGSDLHREGSVRGGVGRLTVELDNLRAAAGWLGDQGRGDDLLALCRDLFMFLVMTAPGEGLGWYRRALDCTPDLAVQERVDVLGELGLLSMNTGDYDGEGSGGPSISLAATAGLLHSPWAWYARTVALHVAADFDGGQKAAETTIVVADQRDEPFCAAMAMAAIAGFLASAGELDRSAQLAADTIRRAGQLSDIGQRHHVITTAAISYVSYRAEPDFDTAMTVLIANPVDPESAQPVIGLFRDLVSGLAHLGLGHTGPAVDHLTRSLRLTDRTGHYTARDQIVRALAVAYAQAGQLTVAAQLVGYTQAHLASFRTTMPIDHWLDQRLAAAAAALGNADWTRAAETGAQLDRRSLMRLITRAEHDLVDPLTTGQS